MPLETVNYIADLVATNPAGTDQKSQGSNHIRNIKLALRQTFPTGVSGPVAFGGWQSKTDAVLTKTADYPQAASDDGKLIYFNLSAPASYTLLAAATAGNGFVVWVLKGATTSLLTIVAGDQIDNLSSIDVGPNEGGMCYCDGVNWWWIGKDATRGWGVTLIHRQENDGLAYSGLKLRRSRTTPAISDLGTALDWEHKDSAGNFDTVARLLTSCLDPVNGSEDYELLLQTIVGGALASRFHFYQGLYADGLADLGLGTVNAKGLAVNGSLLSITDIVVTGTTASPGVADHGKTYIATGAGFTLTLPLLANVPAGYRVGLANQVSSGSCVANRNAAPDTITSQATSGILTLTLPSVGDQVTFIADPANNRWFVRGNRTYQSAVQTLTSSGQLILPHTLSVQPTRITTWLKNVSGATKLSYPANDELLVPSYPGDVQAATNKGMVIQSDTVNVNVAFNSAAALFALVPKTGGAGSNITNADWNLIVRATAVD